MSTTKMLYMILLFHVANAFNYQQNQNIFYDIAEAQTHFQAFMKTYNKTYQSHAEEAERFEIFKKNLVKINEKNIKDSSGVFAINKFTDMTNEEFTKKQSGLSEFLSKSGFCDIKTEKDMGNNASAEYDWRDYIHMAVKNQFDCKACWAFAATANVEAVYAKKYKTTILLSEQQMIDCASDSCNDGIPAQALRYLIQVGGQELENEYPYANKHGKCKFSPAKAMVRVTNCVTFALADEESIKQALHEYGPVTAGIDSTSLMTYDSGILQQCTFTKLNHAVLIVGYGTDTNGTNFWVIKNSWGPNWGEQGYARIKRGVNACGIHNLHLASALVL